MSRTRHHQIFYADDPSDNPGWVLRTDVDRIADGESDDVILDATDPGAPDEDLMDEARRYFDGDLTGHKIEIERD